VIQFKTVVVTSLLTFLKQ